LSDGGDGEKILNQKNQKPRVMNAVTGAFLFGGVFIFRNLLFGFDLE
jgi:hypothetical protein